MSDYTINGRSLSDGQMVRYTTYDGVPLDAIAKLIYQHSDTYFTADLQINYPYPDCAHYVEGVPQAVNCLSTWDLYPIGEGPAVDAPLPSDTTLPTSTDKKSK